MIPNPLFSNQDYYYNEQFKRIWLEYEKISNPDYQQIIYFKHPDPEGVIEQLYENFYQWLYRESLIWFKSNGNGWKVGLE